MFNKIKALEIDLYSNPILASYSNTSINFFSKLLKLFSKLLKPEVFISKMEIKILTSEFFEALQK